MSNTVLITCEVCGKKEHRHPAAKKCIACGIAASHIRNNKGRKPKAMS